MSGACNHPVALRRTLAGVAAANNIVDFEVSDPADAGSILADAVGLARRVSLASARKIVLAAWGDSPRTAVPLRYADVVHGILDRARARLAVTLDVVPVGPWTAPWSSNTFRPDKDTPSIIHVMDAIAARATYLTELANEPLGVRLDEPRHLLRALTALACVDAMSLFDVHAFCWAMAVQAWRLDECPGDPPRVVRHIQKCATGPIHRHLDSIGSTKAKRLLDIASRCSPSSNLVDFVRIPLDTPAEMFSMCSPPDPEAVRQGIALYRAMGFAADSVTDAELEASIARRVNAMRQAILVGSAAIRRRKRRREAAGFQLAARRRVRRRLAGSSVQKMEISVGSSGATLVDVTARERAEKARAARVVELDRHIEVYQADLTALVARLDLYSTVHECDASPKAAHPLRPDQARVACTAINRLRRMAPDAAGTLIVRPPGWGKTFVGLFIALSMTSTSVIVVPPHLIDTWYATIKEHFADFEDSFRFVVARSIAGDAFGGLRRHSFDSEHPGLVYVTTSTMLKGFAGRTFSVMIVDEFHEYSRREALRSLLAGCVFAPVVGLTATLQRGDIESVARLVELVAPPWLRGMFTRDALQDVADYAPHFADTDNPSLRNVLRSVLIPIPVVAFAGACATFIDVEPLPTTTAATPVVTTIVPGVSPRAGECMDDIPSDDDIAAWTTAISVAGQNPWTVGVTVGGVVEASGGPPVVVMVTGVDAQHKMVSTLKRVGLTVAYVGGETPRDQRQDTIHRVRQGDFEVLVASPKVCGTGIDLSFARDVFFTDPVGAGTDSFFQAATRVVRRPEVMASQRVHLCVPDTFALARLARRVAAKKSASDVFRAAICKANAFDSEVALFTADYTHLWWALRAIAVSASTLKGLDTAPIEPGHLGFASKWFEQHTLQRLVDTQCAAARLLRERTDGGVPLGTQSEADDALGELVERARHALERARRSETHS